jgi:hypothetical protein
VRPNPVRFTVSPETAPRARAEPWAIRWRRLRSTCAGVFSLNCELGSVGIHREFITAAARWIMEAKL